MSKKRSFIGNIFLFLKGLSMGAANKVPGVSGGTVAFVLGFYEELIYSFQKFNGKALKLFFTGKFQLFFRYINAKFLLLVMGGSTFSYFSISLLMDYLITRYELYVWSTFFGMILGSVYYISKGYNHWSRKSSIYALLGIVVGVSLSLMNPAKENDNLLFVFICGVIGVSGMTLPGLSGSFILILLGNYVLLLIDSVNALSVSIADVFTGDWSFLQDEVRVHYLKIVGVFTAGSLFGLISISHILGYVLKKWCDIVVAVIIGFITGSLGIVWPWKKEICKLEGDVFLLDVNGNKIVENYQRFIPDMTLIETWIAIFYICIGFGVLIILDIYSKREHKKI